MSFKSVHLCLFYSFDICATFRWRDAAGLLVNRTLRTASNSNSIGCPSSLKSCESFHKNLVIFEFLQNSHCVLLLPHFDMSQYPWLIECTTFLTWSPHDHGSASDVTLAPLHNIFTSSIPSFLVSLFCSMKHPVPRCALKQVSQNCSFTLCESFLLIGVVLPLILHPVPPDTLPSSNFWIYVNVVLSFVLFHERSAGIQLLSILLRARIARTSGTQFVIVECVTHPLGAMAKISNLFFLAPHPAPHELELRIQVVTQFRPVIPTCTILSVHAATYLLFWRNFNPVFPFPCDDMEMYHMLNRHITPLTAPIALHLRPLHHVPFVPDGLLFFFRAVRLDMLHFQKSHFFSEHSRKSSEIVLCESPSFCLDPRQRSSPLQKCIQNVHL